MKVAVVLAVVILTQVAARAQELPEPFLNGNPEAAILRRPPAAARAPRWRQETATSLMDGSRTEAVATQDVTDAAFRKTLVIRCLEGKTSVSLAGFPRVRQGDRVMARLGSAAAAVAEGWRVTDDARFIGLWDAAPAIAFARSLLAARTLSVRVLGPPDAVDPEPNDAQFNLEGLDKAIAGVRAACKW